MGLVEQLKSLVTKTSKAAKKASPDAAKTCKVKLADAKKKTKEAETIAKKAIKLAKGAMSDLEKAKTRKVVVVKLRGKGKKTRRRGGVEGDLPSELPKDYRAAVEEARKGDEDENPKNRVKSNEKSVTLSNQPTTTPPDDEESKDPVTVQEGGRHRMYSRRR